MEQIHRARYDARRLTSLQFEKDTLMKASWGLLVAALAAIAFLSLKESDIDVSQIKFEAHLDGTVFVTNGHDLIYTF